MKLITYGNGSWGFKVWTALLNYATEKMNMLESRSQEAVTIFPRSLQIVSEGPVTLPRSTAKGYRLRIQMSLVAQEYLRIGVFNNALSGVAREVSYIGSSTKYLGGCHSWYLVERYSTFL